MNRSRDQLATWHTAGNHLGSAPLLMVCVLLAGLACSCSGKSHSSGETCSSNVDCSGGRVCDVSGVCVLVGGCTQDSDCGPGQVCLVTNVCAGPAVDGGALRDAGGAPDAGAAVDAGPSDAGSVQEDAGPVQASVTPASAFGNVAAQTVASDTVVVTNNDSTAVVIVSGAITDGGSVFAVAPPPGDPIQPSGTAHVTLSYAPIRVEQDQGIATILVRRSDTPTAAPTALTVQLSGESVPVIQVAPAQLMFGDQITGNTTTDMVVITNTGVDPLSVESVALTVGTAAAFGLEASSASGAVLSPGGHVSFSVSYQPVAESSSAPDIGGVQISSGDPVTPTVTVPLSGQCTDCVCASTRTCSGCGVQQTCASGGGCTAARRVFVTQASSDAKLGGASGADTLCNTYATQAGLGGTWMAVLADSTTAPESRFTLASVPYVLLDGTVVATTGAELLSGTLQNAIDRDECQLAVTDAEVWTGLDAPSETQSSSYCGDFLSDSSTATYSPVGLTSSTSTSWYDAYLQFCNHANPHLYCVEQ